MAKSRVRHERDMFARNSVQNSRARLVNMYFRKIADLCMGRFVWHGLPSEIDVRFLEKILFEQALAVFYWRNDLGAYLALPGTGRGIDIYDNPLEFDVIGNQWVHDRLKATQCVPIWGNNLRVPDMDIVTTYAARLADMDLTIDMDIVGVRHPMLLVGDEKAKLSLQNAYRQLVEGTPVMMAYETFGERRADKIQAVDLGVKTQDISDIQVAKTRIWNECMNLLGINASNQDKRERLVADEVAANDDIVSMCRGTALDSRRRACDMINVKYGLSVGVEWRPNEIVSDNSEPVGPETEEGVEDGGSVHADAPADHH